MLGGLNVNTDVIRRTIYYNIVMLNSLNMSRKLNHLEREGILRPVEVGHVEGLMAVLTVYNQCTSSNICGDK